MPYFLLFFLIWSVPPLADAAADSHEIASIDGIRVGRTSGRSRVVFDLSGPLAFKIKKLDSPPRFAVEFERVDNALVVAKNTFSKTPITDLTIHSAGDSRYTFTFDLISDAIDAHVFPLLPYQARGYRLVLDFFESPEEILGSTKVVSPRTAEPPVPEKEKRDDSFASPRSMDMSQLDTGDSQFSGTWEHEWSYADSNSSSQKFESVIEPRWDQKLSDTLSFTAIVRARLDATGDLGPDEQRPKNYSQINGPLHNEKYSELSVRELYVDFDLGDSFLRLGKQQIVWGQADGIKILDVVNPQSFREFILDDFSGSRIPLWTVKLDHSVGDFGNLEFLWIPDTSYHEFAEIGSPYFITSPKLVPNLPISILLGGREIDKPDDPFSDADAGVRLTSFWGGWDVSFNYLYHYQDTPVYYQNRLPSGDVELRPEYERNNLLGGTLSNAFGDVTVRAEVAYNSDTFNLTSDLTGRGILESAEVSSVLGLDWQTSSDMLVSTQWFYSRLLDYKEGTIRDQDEQMVSLLLQRDLYNAAWQIRMLSLYSFNDKDSLVQLKLKYWVNSSLEVWLGADIFGGNRLGLFGQFEDEDRVLIGFKYGF
ncbi:MAG: hypothetical protein ACJASY_003579 [Halioglobus sp.]|jgi:hypothetical protein